MDKNSNWNEIWKKSDISEQFIRKHIDKVNWIIISKYQNLSEEFIRQYKNELAWGRLCAHQKMSINFLRQFRDYVDWDTLSYFIDKEVITPKFIFEFQDYINKYFIQTLKCKK